MSNYHPLQETFGIELEFLYYFTRAQGDDFVASTGIPFSLATYQPRDFLYFRQRVQDWLEDAGLEVNDCTDFNSTNPRDYSKWTVLDEDLDPHGMPYGFLYVPLEVTSRILYRDQPSYDEVHTAMNALMEFPLGPPIITVGSSVHVHAGNTENYFPLRMMKNLTQLLLAFEFEIESLHPPERVNLDGEYNIWAWPISLSRYLHPKLGPVAGIAVIERCQTLSELQWKWQPGKDGDTNRYIAVNFSHLDNENGEMVEDGGKPRKQTIEFRQHKGTPYPLVILRWVEFVLGLVRFANTVSDSHLMYVVMTHLHHWPDEGYSFEELLRIIGCEHLIDHYKYHNRQYEHPRRIREEMDDPDPDDETPDVTFLWEMLNDVIDAMDGEENLREYLVYH